jgi:hypothetical protein
MFCIYTFSKVIITKDFHAGLIRGIIRLPFVSVVFLFLPHAVLYSMYTIFTKNVLLHNGKSNPKWRQCEKVL